ncbi:MAG: topoisomerase DNA-binding C4 zinc finger domain-containing protein [Ferrimonas sp.]
MSKIDHTLFSNPDHRVQDELGSCPECAQALELKHGKHGAFIGCSAYPSCYYHRPLIEKNAIDDEIMVGTQCPQCHAELALKSGRYGFYIACRHHPVCAHVERQHDASETVVLPACPSCQQGTLTQRTNRFGKTFYACSHYPGCRYVLNDKPVSQSCPECQWPLLTLKKARGKQTLCCPQRTCKYQMEQI